MPVIVTEVGCRGTLCVLSDDASHPLAIVQTIHTLVATGRHKLLGPVQCCPSVESGKYHYTATLVDRLYGEPEAR